jgi:hypothetical protein
LRPQRTTGLTIDQFATLVLLAREAFPGWHAPAGRKRGLTLARAVKAVLMYAKNNVTQEFIGEVFEVSQPTVSRAIALLTPVIADLLKKYVPDPGSAGTGRVLVIDGSLHPCWSWKGHQELYSGKHHTTGHCHQYLATLDGDLIHVSDPVPGSTHDAKAITQTQITSLIKTANTIGDKGYTGTGIITPIRKPRGGQLPEQERNFNKQINQLRYVIERCIAHFKTWRIMHTDYRRPLNTYTETFHMIRALEFFKQAF